jgi:hypothetical protein
VSWPTSTNASLQNLNIVRQHGVLIPAASSHNVNDSINDNINVPIQQSTSTAPVPDVAPAAQTIRRKIAIPRPRFAQQPVAHQAIDRPIAMLLPRRRVARLRPQFEFVDVKMTDRPAIDVANTLEKITAAMGKLAMYPRRAADEPLDGKSAYKKRRITSGDVEMPVPWHFSQAQFAVFDPTHAKPGFGMISRA